MDTKTTSNGSLTNQGKDDEVNDEDNDGDNDDAMGGTKKRKVGN